MPVLEGWESFYVIIGTAAGALIGLQFVVMTLIADLPISRGNVEAGDAYSTPTVVHLSAVLFLAAIVSAPWRSITAVAVLWGILGLGGALYVVAVAWRLRAQAALADAYQAVFEDWLFHALLPLAAYILLIAAACMAYSHARSALFFVGAASLLLLFISIHNAWDTVTYHVLAKRQEQRESE